MLVSAFPQTVWTASTGHISKCTIAMTWILRWSRTPFRAGAEFAIAEGVFMGAGISAIAGTLCAECADILFAPEAQGLPARVVELVKPVEEGGDVRNEAARCRTQPRVRPVFEVDRRSQLSCARGEYFRQID
jgi:hypothetical protein